MRKLGVRGRGGLKKKWQATLGFHTRLLVFAQCVKLVWHAKISPNDQNDFARSTKISQGVRIWFVGCAKISQSDQNDFVRFAKILLGVRIWFAGYAKIRTPWEMISWFRMTCENFEGCVNCPVFSSVWNSPAWNPPAIDHKKYKLNQTKIKLKQEIKIKTSNITGKLLN